MGSSNSGNWLGRPGRKTTVEKSVVLAVREFRWRMADGVAGTVTWPRLFGESSVCFRIARHGEGATVTLSYRRNNTEDIHIPVAMQTTRTRHDGRRWWFTCPLAVRGVACGRRVGKLYLPPRQRYFGCRTCHNLTYRSCQQSRTTERVLARFGYGPEFAKLFTQAAKEFRALCTRRLGSGLR